MDNFAELKHKLTPQWIELCKRFPYEKGFTLQLDGVINKEKWDKTPVKILFVLKESYRKGSKFDEGNNDYISDMLQKINNWESRNELFDTYKMIDIWLKVITKNICQKEYSISSCSIINVSKKGLYNESHTKKTTLTRALKDSGDILCEQIKAINPDIIIFGNTFYNCFETLKKHEVLETSNTYETFIENNLKAYIDSNHIYHKGNNQEKMKTSLDLFKTDKYLIFSAYHPLSRSFYRTKIEDFESIINNNKDLFTNLIK